MCHCPKRSVSLRNKSAKKLLPISQILEIYSVKTLLATSLRLIYRPVRFYTQSGEFLFRTSKIPILLNGEKLYFKYQGHVGPDLAPGASFSIGELGWNKNLPFGAHGHELQDFAPAGNDPALDPE